MDGTLRIDWAGTDWQTYVAQLLRLRRGTGGFQQVPDTDRGDCGIEGFTPDDGCCYQCYAPAEPLTPKTRYEAHRDKITQDVGKFIKNANKLSKLLAATKIRRWLLVVPLFDSKDTVAHCQSKTLEIRKANLPYTTPDINVGIIDQTEFDLERKQLFTQGLAKLDLPVISAPAPVLQNSLLKSLESKIEKLVPPPQRADLVALLLKEYADGNLLLENLRRQYGTIFEQVEKQKRTKERSLELRSTLATEEPKQLLAELMKEMRSELDSIQALTTEHREALVYEFVTDWLLRCPLHFP